MQSAQELEQFRLKALSDLPLVARNREVAKVMALVGADNHTLICGSVGLGKTRLLLEVKRKLEADGVEPLYLRFRQPLRAFLVEIAAQLDVTSSHDSSTNLRGALWKVFQARPRVLLLDGVGDPTHPFYRFLERIVAVRGNTLIATAAHFHATGSLQRIFWNLQNTISLLPLCQRDSMVLAESAIQKFLSQRPPENDFCDRVTKVARGNPGRIVDMCIRAADPSYRAKDDHFRFGALLMDSLMGITS